MNKYRHSVEDIKTRFIKSIAQGFVHPHKKHCENEAEFWRRMITGEEQECYILSYRKSETDKQKEQRIRLTVTDTPYIINKIRTTWKEVDRSDKIDTHLLIQNSAEKAEERLQERLDCFNGNLSMEKYLNEQGRELNFEDANAFLFVDFHEFEATTEQPFSYPTIVYSAAPKTLKFDPKASNKYHVVEDHAHWRDYDYWNGTLQYLFFDDRIAVEIQSDGKKSMSSADQFFCISRQKNFRLTEILENQTEIPEVGPNAEIISINMDTGTYTIPIPGGQLTSSDFNINENKKARRFLLETMEHKLEYVPAMQVGYIKDPKTKGKTYCSPLNPARHILCDLIWKKSELDTILACLGFVRAYQYVPSCDYKDQNTKKVCNLGQVNGHDCPKCNGTGKRGGFQRSNQDIMTLELSMDDPPRPDAIIDLSKLVHYVEAPKETIEMIERLVNERRKEVALAIFNTNVFDRKELVAATATEIRANYKAVNNVLYEYACHRGALEEFAVKVTANYMDLKVEYTKNYPNDFKLESLGELLTILKSAKDANAPAEVIRDINYSILAKQNNSDTEIRRVKAREKFRPFNTFSENERVSIIAMLPQTHKSRILYTYFDEIMNDIEFENRRNEFFNLAYPKQKELIAEKVDAKAQEIALESTEEAFEELIFEDEATNQQGEG